MSGTLLSSRAGAVLTLTLSHPGKFNAMSRAMWRELRSVFDGLHGDTSLRCVVMTGADGHFCSGGDISEYAGFRFAEPSLREFHEGEVWGGLQAMLDCDIPIVAAIDGNCMGAGLEIASCCDMRLAAPLARFGAPIAKLGFPMAPREAALVAHVAGELTAREMLLSAAVLDAEEMKRRGFLNRLEAEPLTAAGLLALRIAALAPGAARQNKQLLRAFAGQGRQQVLETLGATAYAYADSAEHREGIAAFDEKRAPEFRS
jgi:enoyl-CoA hydratase/carnithine racemase